MDYNENKQNTMIENEMKNLPFIGCSVWEEVSHVKSLGKAIPGCGKSKDEWPKLGRTRLLEEEKKRSKSGVAGGEGTTGRRADELWETGGGTTI